MQLADISDAKLAALAAQITQEREKRTRGWEVMDNGSLVVRLGSDAHRIIFRTDEHKIKWTRYKGICMVESGHAQSLDDLHRIEELHLHFPWGELEAVWSVLETRI